MADFITPVIDILTRLCGYCSKWADAIRQLGDNLATLRNASSRLNDRYRDIKNKVESADPELTVLEAVKGWMGRVEVLQNEVQTIRLQGDEEIKAKCFGGRCPKNCRASYKLQKVVTQKLSVVNELISEGHFDVVADNLLRDTPYKLPVGKVVGVESVFEELCSCFENNEVGIIGLYGTGGVGKTTLLKKFNNDFLPTKAGFVVIWVVASKDVDPGKLQDAIRKKLRVQDHNWNDKTEDDRATSLFNILKEKKFVLLLDDVWERIDLVKLGVPSPDNQGCKIIFTTRSEDVCNAMEAQKRIKVNFLTLDKAFELFKEKVGETILQDTRILPLARQVVDECQGLPLALCTVGRAMANKENPNEWKRAVEILRSRPSEVQGMVEEVYYLLKFSYDRLPDPYKPCFLYCALFPEDYNIPKEEIILLWIAEGFLAEFDYDIYEARKQGVDIISSLKYACLLENGEEENTIKMHDVVRDMALWIACDHGKKTRIFVRDYAKTSGLEVYKHAKWKEVERLSMCGKGEMTRNLSQKLHCPNLITLLIRGTSIQVFPAEVFVLPTTIRVLDLSYNEGIRNLPSIIGDFVDLEYMNLSGTHIRKLPEELKNLKKLRFLLLDEITELDIPKGVISSLSSLQTFSMLWCQIRGIDENALLNELESLYHLQDVRIYLFESSSVKKLLMSSKFQRCVSDLFVDGSSILHDLLSSLGKMEHLNTLLVSGPIGHEGFEDEDIPRSSFWGHEHIIILRKLILKRCQNILDLNLLIHAPNLEVLELVKCHSLVEVISDNFGTTEVEIVKSNLFCSLTRLHLNSLSNLSSICRMALQFPFLEVIHVNRCPNLKKLPFNSQSALKKLRHITADREWMDELQWEDEATKYFLLSKFDMFERDQRF